MDYYVPWGITNPDVLEPLTVKVSDSQKISSLLYKQALRAKLEELLEKNPEDKSLIPEYVGTVDVEDAQGLPNSELADLIEQGDEWTSLLESLQGDLQPRRVFNQKLYEDQYNNSTLSQFFDLLG